MAINSQHITGFVIGLGAAAAGFYFYKKNQKQVDEWLRRQGIELPVATGCDYGSMTMEDLAREKEHLEDLLAEREYAAQQEAEEAEAPAAESAPKRARTTRKRTNNQGPDAAPA
jgi:septal ring factor EnvC (AmiA/AmiB activator)